MASSLVLSVVESVEVVVVVLVDDVWSSGAVRGAELASVVFESVAYELVALVDYVVLSAKILCSIAFVD